MYGHFAVVGAAEDQLAHFPGKPFDEMMFIEPDQGLVRETGFVRLEYLV